VGKTTMKREARRMHVMLLRVGLHERRPLVVATKHWGGTWL
jgi:hypothetical protein